MGNSRLCMTRIYVSAVISHDEDLLEIFGSEMMSKVESERNPRRWLRIMVAITIFKFIFIIYELRNS